MLCLLSKEKCSREQFHHHNAGQGRVNLEPRGRHLITGQSRNDETNLPRCFVLWNPTSNSVITCLLLEQVFMEAAKDGEKTGLGVRPDFCYSTVCPVCNKTFIIYTKFCQIRVLVSSNWKTLCKHQVFLLPPLTYPTDFRTLLDAVCTWQVPSWLGWWAKTIRFDFALHHPTKSGPIKMPECSFWQVFIVMQIRFIDIIRLILWSQPLIRVNNN